MPRDGHWLSSEPALLLGKPRRIVAVSRFKFADRGVELTRHCQSSLKAAQQKVEILLKRNGQSGVETFTPPDETAGQA